MTKHLNVQQVNKLMSTSKLERSTADQSPYDAKMVAYGQNDNESSFKADEVILEIERLKEIVEKWKNKYRILEQTVSILIFREKSSQSGNHRPKKFEKRRLRKRTA